MPSPPEQAKELLPLWETLQVLDGSDTAATEEKDALTHPDPGNDDQGTDASHHCLEPDPPGYALHHAVTGQASTFGGSQ